MDYLELQLQPHQLRTQPFHYLINEQAKSLLALQELQNEVGALLEFRDLVMETFPNLRQKMSSVNAHSYSHPPNYCSNIPIALMGSLNSRQWEPGIKVKRKIINKSDNESSFGRVRSNSHGSKIHSSQPKSSEAISGVQDSGFSTETNSSNKDHASSTATSVPLPGHSDGQFFTRKENAFSKELRRSEYEQSDEDFSEDGLVLKPNEAEEELWNLLDVIYTKGTKLREEVEYLKLRLLVDDIEKQIQEKEWESRKMEKKFFRRCRSLENLGESNNSLFFSLSENENFQSNFKYPDASLEEELFFRKRPRSMELEDIDKIREERNLLLDKLAEMETENLANRLKTSELQNEITALVSTKEELQEQLLQAMKQKNELNCRIHELHLKFLSNENNLKGDKNNVGGLESSQSKTSSSSSSLRLKSLNDDSKIATSIKNNNRSFMKEYVDYSNKFNVKNTVKNLGALDGIVSNPKRINEYCRITKPNRRKLEAILKEKNYLELQRHLLVSVVENQALNSQLETSLKSQEDLCEQLDKYKEENDELKFQLEERNIELEGTKAQVRILEKLQAQSKLQTESNLPETLKPDENFPFLENDHLRLKGFSETEINRARHIFLSSQNKKVEKSEVLRVLKRPVKSNDSLVEKLELPNGFELSKKNSNVIPVLALPMPIMSSNLSSEAESTQALEISSELESDMARTEKNESLKNDKSPYRRRPSRIPLNIQKSPKALANSNKKTTTFSALAAKSANGDANKHKDNTTTTLTMTFKKTSLADNANDSISSHRSPLRNSSLAKGSSLNRVNSPSSITSQRYHTSATPIRQDKRKSLNNSLKDDSSHSSNSFASKNLSLKQTTNFSNIRQRDTLSRKNNTESLDSTNKKTLRGTLRESFRTKSSNESLSNGSKRDTLTSRKESVQQKQNRTVSPSSTHKNSKAILVNDTDVTKVRPTKLSFWSNWLKILDTNNTA